MRRGWRFAVDAVAAEGTRGVEAGHTGLGGWFRAAVLEVRCAPYDQQPIRQLQPLQRSGDGWVVRPARATIAVVAGVNRRDPFPHDVIGLVSPVGPRRDRRRGAVPLRGLLSMHDGVAPIPVSSGRTECHRLPRRGNRQLDAALAPHHHHQLRLPGPGQTYYQRRRAQREATTGRARLKRRIARAVYQHLKQTEQPSITTAKLRLDRGAT
jgi:hypothetical protein